MEAVAVPITCPKCRALARSASDRFCADCGEALRSAEKPAPDTTWWSRSWFNKGLLILMAAGIPILLLAGGRGKDTAYYIAFTMGMFAASLVRKRRFLAFLAGYFLAFVVLAMLAGIFSR